MARSIIMKWVLVSAVFLLFSGQQSLLFGADKMTKEGTMSQEKMETGSSMKKESTMMKKEDTMKADTGMMKEESTMKKQENTMKKESGMMQEKKM